MVLHTKEAELVCPRCGVCDRTISYEPPIRHIDGTLDRAPPGPPRYRKISSLDKWLAKVPVGVLVQNQRQRIRRIFLTLEGLYPRFKGKRKSFLSYSYVVEKLIYYTTGQHMAPGWKRITSANRLREYNRIWDAMMHELPFQ